MCLLRCRQQCNFYRNCHFPFFFSPKLLHCKHLRRILAVQELDSPHQLAATPPGPSCLWPKLPVFVYRGRNGLFVVPRMLKSSKAQR